MTGIWRQNHLWGSSVALPPTCCSSLVTVTIGSDNNSWDGDKMVPLPSMQIWWGLVIEIHEREETKTAWAYSKPREQPSFQKHVPPSQRGLFVTSALPTLPHQIQYQAHESSRIKGQNTSSNDINGRWKFTFPEGWTLEVDYDLSPFFCKLIQRGPSFWLYPRFASTLSSSLSVSDRDTESSRSMISGLGRAGASAGLYVFSN